MPYTTAHAAGPVAAGGHTQRSLVDTIRYCPHWTLYHFEGHSLLYILVLFPYTQHHARFCSDLTSLSLPDLTSTLTRIFGTFSSTPSLILILIHICLGSLVIADDCKALDDPPVTAFAGVDVKAVSSPLKFSQSGEAVRFTYTVLNTGRYTCEALVLGWHVCVRYTDLAPLTASYAYVFSHSRAPPHTYTHKHTHTHTHTHTNTIYPTLSQEKSSSGR
jgi:hypothetical protein